MKKAFNYLIITFMVISFGAKANNIERKLTIDHRHDVSVASKSDLADMKTYVSAVEKKSSAEKFSASPDCIVAVIGKDKYGNTFHESKNLNNPRGGTTAIQCSDNIRAYLQGLESQGITITSYITSYE